MDDDQLSLVIVLATLLSIAAVFAVGGINFHYRHTRTQDGSETSVRFEADPEEDGPEDARGPASQTPEDREGSRQVPQKDSSTAS